MRLDHCFVGDCINVLNTLAENSVDAIVTDPPYGLTSARRGGRSTATDGAVMKGFMGLAWDGAVPSADIWRECLRVLKPGGYLLAFAGTRTQHRMACAIEDGGFEIRDIIAWVYASGMPKHVSCLKPALEPITMARKPSRHSAHLNIDACRVPTADAKGYADKCASVVGLESNRNGSCYGEWSGARQDSASPLGRWPANLILSYPAEEYQLRDDVTPEQLEELAGWLRANT